VDVSQISMPMRILLIGAVVFLAAWFTILKPGGAEEEVPPVQPANVATTPAPGAAATPEAPEAEDTTVAATAIPADVLAKLPKDVAKAVQARKTLVLGVFADKATNWRPMADDDRYVRNALKKTNRYDGEVFAKNLSLAELSTYGPLVNDLGVTQSPAVVVIDRDLKGTVLTGYVDRVAINQAIADARRDTVDPLAEDEFLSAANDVCARFNVLFSRLSQPTIRGKKARNAAMRRLVDYGVKYADVVRSTPAPAEWKTLKQLWLRSIVTDRLTAQVMFRLIKDTDIPAYLVDYRGFDAKLASKLDRRFDAAGLTACVDNRRS
jgi:hypothetical protein